MKRASVVAVCLLAVAAYANVPKPDVFYVYHDKGDAQNHFIPSGWMGDYGDLKINDGYSADKVDGKTSIEWIYSAKATEGANWTGAYWQAPANNWGSKQGGFDISGYKRLTFWAKSDKMAKATFKVGGITGEYGDSDAAEIGPVEVGPKWKQYTIDLADKNLSHVIGGFCWAASRDDNQDGFKLYLDEIRFEK